MSTPNRLFFARVVTVAAAIVATGALADWQYHDQTDPMTSKKTSFAMLESNTLLNLDSPYKGVNHGNLMVRRHPKYGQSVIYKIDKGQIMCSSYNGCPVSIRFDDKPAITFSGTEPADNDPTTVFLNNSGRFIEMARKAKRILVQVNIFHNGAPIVEFNTSKPLEWSAAPTKGK